MARLLALFAAAILTIQAGEVLVCAAPLAVEAFWRAVLPDAPMPDSILQLLHHDTNFLSKTPLAGKVRRPNYAFPYENYKVSPPKPTAGNHVRAASPSFSSQVGMVGNSRPRKDDPFDYDYKPGRRSKDEPFDYDYKPGQRRKDDPFDYDYKPGRLRRDEPFDYDYKPSSKRLGDVAGEPTPTPTPTPTPFGYVDYKAPSKRSGKNRKMGKTPATTMVFFHEEAARVGESLAFYFPLAATAELGFLPRHVADSLPFSTSAVPEVLALFGIAPGSVEAAEVRETLGRCERPPVPGETNFCATSLETMVEHCMAALGTRDIRAAASAVPKAGAPLQLYTVRAVRPVEGFSFLACHDQAYPYAVYRCHTSGPARAYMLDMEGDRGSSVTVAAVCHTDTSHWNPEHVAFLLLGVKPGGAPVCHVMPYGHLLWAKNEKRSSA